MKLWRNRILLLCALTFALTASGQDTEDEVVRPSGIAPGPVRKARAVTAKDKEDLDSSSSPVQKSTKSTRARSHRTHARPKETPESTPAPTEYTPDGIPKTGAASVIVVDANNGQILYEKNADEVRAAASTQKLLTALIVAEHGFLDQPVVVQTIDTMAWPVKLTIKAGDTYQRLDLLRALLVKSPNDVARCLARDNAGSVEAFAQVMNRRAQQLGAAHSHFMNPNGLPIPGQYSTARDLSLIARAAYANPTIRSILCVPQLVFRFANGRTRELENTNKLLRRLPYCNGMKTGYTDAAGKCFIARGAPPGQYVTVVGLGETLSKRESDRVALRRVSTLAN